MIDLMVPIPLLWLLRWALFLGPLASVIVLGVRNRGRFRALVGALFAFLYGLGLIFVTHQMAILYDWWHYGGDTVMINGLPADIWIGGALFFGPVLFLAFPTVSPFVLLLPILLGLHGTLFQSLAPFVFPGPYWYAGVPLVFATAHLPAIYLAQWTAQDRHLPMRAALLAVGYGAVAFVVLPSIIMVAMGGTWSLLDRPVPLLACGALLLGLCCVIGLSAVQMFVIHGGGTAIPLDPTKRLVRSGIFAYVRNPMQLCTALAWIIVGIVLQNIWIASAALMAWVFVAGMVRWHHRNDLMLRFPENWPEYIAHVPEWSPRWRPWIKQPSSLTYDPGNKFHLAFLMILQKTELTGLGFATEPRAPLAYNEGSDQPSFTGMAAIAKALNHANFALALLGAGALLIVLPAVYLVKREPCPQRAAGFERAA